PGFAGAWLASAPRLLPHPPDDQVRDPFARETPTNPAVRVLYLIALERDRRWGWIGAGVGSALDRPWVRERRRSVGAA
ncbi:MAG TPA: hypothetical protein VNE21_02540, partial [Mycobacteriales bacterium]|nr:hypothetical protein [Mycobacteriales bacterium]